MKSWNEKSLKVGIIGAGALGGFYGALLAKAGHSVSFIARGATLAALQSVGLRVELDDETIVLPDVHATEDPADIGIVDVLIVATKSYAFDAIAPALRCLKGPETIVLPLQNGIDSAERLGALSDTAHILGGLTYLPAKRSAPNVIRQAGPQKPVLLGALHAGDEDAAAMAFDVLQHAGICVEQPADIRVALWMKYLLALCTMGVQSVARKAIGPTLTDPETRALYVACLEEGVAVASALGIKLPTSVQEQLLATMDSYPPEIKASMLQDLEAGRPLELEAMHGTLVRLGIEHGVPTPTIQSIYSTLKPCDIRNA